MSTKNAAARAANLKSLAIYFRHFVHYCYILRGLLGVHFLFIILSGIFFARYEGLTAGQGVYFSLITSTTVGYGDITPKTGVGQCISVLIALSGTVLFGLVVAVATKALSVTVNEYKHAHDSSANS